MSNLPNIDPAKVEQKLLAKVADLTSQVVRLEALAEALRDERDQLDDLRTQQESAESSDK